MKKVILLLSLFISVLATSQVVEVDGKLIESKGLRNVTPAEMQKARECKGDTVHVGEPEYVGIEFVNAFKYKKVFCYNNAIISPDGEDVFPANIMPEYFTGETRFAWFAMFLLLGTLLAYISLMLSNITSKILLLGLSFASLMIYSVALFFILKGILSGLFLILTSVCMYGFFMNTIAAFANAMVHLEGDEVPEKYYVFLRVLAVCIICCFSLALFI